MPHPPVSTLRTRAVTAAAIATVLALAACGGDTATAPAPEPAPPGGTPSGPAAVASIAIGSAPDTIEVGDVLAHTAVTRDSAGGVLSGRTVRWTVSDAAVASIDSVSGALTGVDRGRVTVTARSEGRVATVTREVVIRYRSISAGSMHACDIASGGVVWCWGLNGTEGRIGGATLGETVHSTWPVRLPTSQRFTTLSTYGRTTCGVTRDHDAYCWGFSGWGMLGNGSTANSAVPVPVSGGHKFRQVVVGSESVCGTTLAGALHCWGYNSLHSFAVTQPFSSTTPVAGAAGMSFASITMGSEYGCGVTDAGAALCWGVNGAGNLGDGKTPSMTSSTTPTPGLVVGGHTFRSLSASSSVTCGVTVTDRGYCWGRGASDRLGTGNRGEVSTPAPVQGGHSFRSITVGYGATCGIDTANAVWCWGSGSNGQLGQQVAGTTGMPVRAGGSLTAAEVSPANVTTGFGSYTCAIGADRLTVYCWGRNDLGQLGNGTTSGVDAVNATPTIVMGQRPR